MSSPAKPAKPAKPEEKSRPHLHFGSDGLPYVDSAFIRACHRAGFVISHRGFGDFSARSEISNKRVHFDRAQGVDFEGQIGRSHRLYGDACGEIIDNMIFACPLLVVTGQQR